MTVQYYNTLLNKIFKREMKTTKTSIGNVPGKDGDEDPNKDR